MAKKASKKKKSNVKAFKQMPTETASSCSCSSGNMWLCKIALIAFIFFIISVIPSLGNWVTQSVSWWIWLIIAIIFGLKPIMSMCGKK